MVHHKLVRGFIRLLHLILLSRIMVQTKMKLKCKIISKLMIRTITISKIPAKQLLIQTMETKKNEESSIATLHQEPILTKIQNKKAQTM